MQVRNKLPHEVVFNQYEPAELVEKHARELAEKLAKGKDQGREATRSQMRRFYQEYLSLRRKIKSGGKEAYEENKVAVKMLISKAKYASGRTNVKIPEEFITWLSNNIKEIKNGDDVETFGQYFEAFMGYFYGETKSSQRRQDE